MNPEMRILILTPSSFPSVTGNAVTAERWRQSLTEKGVIVDVLSSEGLAPRAFVERLQSFHPDLIHVHHAFKTGALLLDSQAESRLSYIPIVVSPGGTDINLDLGMSEKRNTILKVLRMACSIITQSSATARSLREQMPDIAELIVNVPKAPRWFGNEPYDLRAMAGCAPGDVLFFLPAGIRPVKGNLECLLAMEQVYEARPKTRFAAAGPVVDPEYAGRFEQAVARLARFACWIDEIPPKAMRSAYEAADIVLNASLSEGMSNSLLEAIAAGRPVLASDIPGNREPILGGPGDHPAGILFDRSDPADFARKSIDLIDDAQLRKELGRAARLRPGRMPTPEDEADGLISAYQAALRTNLRQR